MSAVPVETLVSADVVRTSAAHLLCWHLDEQEKEFAKLEWLCTDRTAVAAMAHRTVMRKMSVRANVLTVMNQRCNSG